MNWCFQTVVPEKTVESLLDCKENKPVNPKGGQSWIVIGRIDADAPILWPLMWRADSLENTLMLGKIEGKRRKGQQRMRWLDSITKLMHMNLSKFWEIVQDREAWHAAVHEVAKSWTWLSDWTTPKQQQIKVVKRKVRNSNKRNPRAPGYNNISGFDTSEHLPSTGI